MRILHVARRFTLSAWGGTETVVSALISEQRRNGHEAELVATSALDRPGTDTVDGVPVRRFSYSYGRFPLSASAREALDRKGGNPLSPGLLRALLTGRRPAVLHCHTMQRLAGHVRFAARMRHIPYIVQLHGGEFAVPPEEVKEMLAPVRRSLDWGKIPSALLGTRRFLADADLVLVLSSEEEDRGRAALPGVRIERLPNGVDPERFAKGNAERARERWGIPPGSPILLTVARIDPQKGQELIPEILARIPGTHAVLAGPVTVPGHDEVVRARAREAGVLERLHFTGSLLPGGDELADLYRSAAAFLLPSRHEPFGIVVLEAWAAEVPVVATRVGGLSGLVQDGRTGFLRDPGDASGLASAVDRLLNDRALASSFIGAGRVEVRERYSWSAVARRLDILYREISERKRP